MMGNTSSSNTSNNDGFFATLYNYFFSGNEYYQPERRILCTGKWREFPFRRTLLEFALQSPVTELSHEDEGKLQAECAHRLMTLQGYTNMDGYFLYIGAGRGSTQMTVMDSEGAICSVFKTATGYPKDGEPDIEQLRETALKVFEKYGSSINLIVGFDSIFHVLKHDCPVIPDAEKSPETGHLPEVVETKGSDFAKLGYLTDLYPETPMLVVRNFITKDDEQWKISFATGDELMIDLGSGNANLIDPYTGEQLKSFELPSDWMTNDESLIAVSQGLRKLMEYADQLDELLDE